MEQRGQQAVKHDSLSALQSYKEGIHDYLTQNKINDHSKFDATIKYDRLDIHQWDYPVDKPKNVALKPRVPSTQETAATTYNYIIFIGTSERDLKYKTTNYEIKLRAPVKLEQVSIQITPFQNMMMRFHPLHDDLICNISTLSIQNDVLDVEVDSFRRTDTGWSHEYLAFLQVIVAYDKVVPVLRPVRSH